MKLVDVCEPLFQYVCTLNRSARKGGGIFDASQVREEISQILSDMRYAASSDTVLLGRYDDIELVLIFFVDSMIKRSQLSFAGDWESIADERREEAGEDRFFELLDRTLEDKSEAAVDELAIFYTCMGLGFTGRYSDQPEMLRKTMLQVSARVRSMFEANPQSYICPEAYGSLNLSDLIQPPAASLGGVGIALVGLLGVLLVVYVYLYRDGSNELKRALKKIVADDRAALLNGGT